MFAMTGEEFRWCCRMLWGDAAGPHWGAAEAQRFLGVTERNVLYWANDTKPIPPGVVMELGNEMRRRLADPTEEAAPFRIIRHVQQLMRVARGPGVG